MTIICANAYAFNSNRNGYIDFSEAARNNISIDQFKALDKNHDGRLTPDEIEVDTERHKPKHKGPVTPSREVPGHAEGPTEN
jgi:hypothetical protein